MDAMAALVFPHFGFGGWKEHYTGYFPAWYLSYALPLWAKGIERERGWGPQALFNLPPDFEIPFFDPEDVKASIGEVVRHTIEEQGWGPMLDVVREMPCAEDFEPWDTNVRKDFLRKGYGYQEIADKLGYKTHSAVVKRMEAIKRRFIQYEQETGR